MTPHDRRMEKCNWLAKMAWLTLLLGCVLAFLVTMRPEIPDRHRALLEVNRVLKPGGMLSITEEFLDLDYPLARTTIRLAREAGFRLVERYGNWFVYTINFQKPA